MQQVIPSIDITPHTRLMPLDLEAAQSLQQKVAGQVWKHVLAASRFCRAAAALAVPTLHRLSVVKLL